MDRTVIFNEIEIREQMLPYKGKSEFNWLPLITIDTSTNNLLGINDSAMWVCGKGNFLHEVADTRSGCLLTPILKERLVFFVERLKKAVLEKKVPTDILLSFPFDALMCAGIQGAADAVDSAYDWVDQGYPVSDKVAERFARRNLRVPKISQATYDERIKYILSLST
ncbi:MAG TPA: hypothetical protein DCS87_00030 [Rheinheimera sp.]|nr:hypothetical protein [Rheinheimera sp.]